MNKQDMEKFRAVTLNMHHKTMSTVLQVLGEHKGKMIDADKFAAFIRSLKSETAAAIGTAFSREINKSE